MMQPGPFPPSRRARHAIAAVLLLAVALVGCRGSTQARLLEIQALQQAGEYENTIDPLREILSKEPDNADANFLLGVALLRTGRTSLAVFPLRKAADSDKHAVAAGLTLASTLLGTQNFEMATEAATRVLEKDPEMVSALTLRAQAAISAGHPAAGLEDAERVLEIQPDDFRAHTLKAGALVDLERYDEAEAQHKKLNELAAALGDPDTEARACAVLGRFYAGREQHDEADAQFAQCLERFPGHQTVLEFASSYRDEQGQEEAGNEVWRRAIEELPDNQGLRVRLARRLDKQGRVDEAEATLVETAGLFDTAQTWLMLADFRRKHDDITGAVEASEHALERAGGSEQLRFQHADLLVSAGEIDRAEQLAAELTQPEYKDVLHARILLGKGDAAGALAAIEPALVLWPNNAGARNIAGRAAERQGDLDRALREYQEAYRADQSTSDAALSIARIHFARGEYAEAASWTRTDLEKRESGHRDATLLAARIAAARQDYQAAREWAEKLAALGADPLTVTLARVAVERSASGPEASLAVIEQSELDLSAPENVDALGAMTADLLALGRTQQAMAGMDAALAAHPDSAALHELKGRMLLRLDRRDEAGTAFERSRELDPELASPLAGLALLASLAGDDSAAIDLAQQAITKDPQNVEATYFASQALLRLGRKQEAEEKLRRVLALDATHVGACNDLAWLLAERGEQLELARSLARRAVHGAPIGQTYDTLGWVELKGGDADAAVEALRRALELDPDSASIRYRLGVAVAAQGDAENGLALLKQALEAGDFPESEAARSEIARLEQR